MAHYRWLLDWCGPSGVYDQKDLSQHATLQKAVAAGAKFLSVQKQWARKFDVSAVQGIEDAIERLEAAPLEGRVVHFTADTHTGYRMSVRIRREQIPDEEWEAMRQAKIEAAKAKTEGARL